MLVRAAARRRLTAIAAALLFAALQATAARASYPARVLNTPNLVGYWTFETDLHSVVNGHTGAAQGNAAIGGAASGPPLVDVPNNHALLLDGNGDFLLTSLDTEAGFDAGATIVAWVYMNVLPSSVPRLFYVAGKSHFTNDLDVEIETDDKVHFYVGGGSNTSAPQSLPSGVWVHVVAALDDVSGLHRIYLNGALAISITEAPNEHASNATEPFTLGNSPTFPGRFFEGRMDEVAIFERALSAGEVAEIYSAASCLFCDGLESGGNTNWSSHNP